MTPVGLYVIAVAVRLVLLAAFPDPAYPDAYYYYAVADSLATGRGFEIDFIWVFPEVGGTIPADPVLPIPSNAHWMPLASIIQAPALLVAGASPAAAAVPLILVGALAAPMTWAVAREAGSRPWIAAGAGLLVAVPAATAAFMAQQDNFGLYQTLALATLWLGARAMRGSQRSFVAAGLVVGLATLSRNDGLLLGAALGLVFAWDRWAAFRSRGRRPPAIRWRTAVGAVLLFAAVMAPWWARQLAVFGSLSPSSATGKVFFIRDYGEWNSITTPADLGHLIGQGVGPLMESRVGGLVAAVSIYAVLVCVLFLLPTALVGAWSRRRSIEFRPFFVYFGLLFAFSAIVSAVHVPGGTFIHSAAALAPQTYILALEGIVLIVAWVARRRAQWDVERASRVFGSAAIVIATLAAVGSTLVLHSTWGRVREPRLRVTAALDGVGAPMSDRLMSIDAGGYWYYTGRGGVVSPNDPIDVVEEVARAYEVAWLVIERDRLVEALAPVIEGSASVSWIGEPVYAEDSEGRPVLDAEGQPRSGPDVAVGVYPVCVTGGDPRCRTRVP